MKSARAVARSDLSCSSFCVRLRARRPREPIRGVRLGLSVGCSLALHAALITLVSLKSCSGDRLPIARASDDPVNVELAWPAPRTKTARPGGGFPATGPDSPPHPSRHLAHRTPPRSTETPESRADPAPPQPPAEIAQAEAAPAAAHVDVVAAPSRHGAPPDQEVDAASGAPALSGTGPGSQGGPGGRGAGAGGAKLPVVSREFAFGGDRRRAFTGVVCFILPGVLRIADVHGCAPVAVFYTNVFDVRERQQPEGFPGISDRSTWFMIEYQGAFTVSKEGTYDFRLHSDDGSYLFIDGTMVIENDGKHKPESRSGSIALASGSHRLRLLYAQTTERMALQLFVHRPGTSLEELFTPHL
jgi:hypothetical protein